jgi:hypothetical protein
MRDQKIMPRSGINILRCIKMVTGLTYSPISMFLGEVVTEYRENEVSLRARP